MRSTGQGTRAKLHPQMVGWTKRSGVDTSGGRFRLAGQGDRMEHHGLRPQGRDKAVSDVQTAYAGVQERVHLHRRRRETSDPESLS